MTLNPALLRDDATCVDAAKMMKDMNIGAVLVTKADGECCGIVTDRDIVIRCVAEGHSMTDTKLSAFCSDQLTRLTPDDDVHNAVELVKKKNVRRFPVLEDGKPVGILSLGDLAQALDPSSALGQVSAAQPNH